MTPYAAASGGNGPSRVNARTPTNQAADSATMASARSRPCRSIAARLTHALPEVSGGPETSGSGFRACSVSGDGDGCAEAGEARLRILGSACGRRWSNGNWSPVTPGFQETQDRYFAHADDARFRWTTSGPGFAETEEALLAPLLPLITLPALEIGCGEGNNLVRLARRGGWTGVDLHLPKL